MKTIKFFLGLYLFSFLFAGCSPRLSPFTDDLYDSNKWTESELKQIQFYLSDDIVMRRVLKGRKAEVVEGKIKTVNGKKVEEVVIKRGTPGVLVFMPKEKRFAISFDKDNDAAFLVFGPNEKRNGQFMLLASEWRKRSGIVTYNGKKYKVSTRNAFAGLMVDLKQKSVMKVTRRKEGGRTVN